MTIIQIRLDLWYQTVRRPWTTVSVMFLSHFKSQAGKRFLKTLCKYEMKLFCQKNNLFLDKLCVTERRTHLHKYVKGAV